MGFLTLFIISLIVTFLFVNFQRIESFQNNEEKELNDWRKQADIYLDWIDKMGDRLDKVEEMESQHNVSVLNEKAAELRVRDNLADPLLPVCGMLQSSHEYWKILTQKGNCNKIHNLLAGFCHAQRLELTGHQNQLHVVHICNLHSSSL